MGLKKRILVVDDEPRVTELLRLLLEGAGYGVVATEDSARAAELLRTAAEAFDAMVSDIRMIPIDGIELLRLSRKVRPAMPVIMVTAYASEETEEEAKALGAAEYIAKPFQIAELLAAVERALGGSSGAGA